MAVRTTMSSLIALVRKMIADPSATQFQDQDIQDRLDVSRDDIRYEALMIAPSIVNTASTGNQASTIYADYYSKFGFWEADVVLQGNNTAGASWVVLTPLVSELLLAQAHWQFETSIFTSGTVPGQLPPLFATGKIYDVNAAAADLLEFWSASLASYIDFSSDGQSFKASQLSGAKLTMACYYRRIAKPRVAKMTRSDVRREGTRGVRLMDSDDIVRGGM